MSSEQYSEIDAITEYRVVDSTSLDGLTAAINQKLKLRQGWEPFGPLFVTMNGRYLQPIIRIESVLEENDDDDGDDHDFKVSHEL
jgi:hypothetical protein